MEADIIIGGIIFVAFVAFIVYWARKKSDERQGGSGPGRGGKDEPPRTDRPGSLDR